MPDRQPEQITFVISEIVNPNRIPEYEAWARGINQAASQYEGFLEVDTIRPRDREHPEYVVIIKFDSYSNFRNWLMSPTYREWINKSQSLIVNRVHQHKRSGLDLWFTLPRDSSQKASEPAFYKQVILGTIAVYPLILLSKALLDPLLKGLPFLLSLLISVVFLSVLLTYPVMPWLTRLLDFWLYNEKK